jgi:hypothetical protein
MSLRLRIRLRIALERREHWANYANHCNCVLPRECVHNLLARMYEADAEKLATLPASAAARDMD